MPHFSKSQKFILYFHPHDYRKFNLSHVWWVLSYPLGVYSRISWYLEAIACRALSATPICYNSSVFEGTGQAVCTGKTRNAPHGGALLYYTQANRDPQGLRVSCEVGGKCGASGLWWVSCNHSCLELPWEEVQTPGPSGDLPGVWADAPLPAWGEKNLLPSLGSFVATTSKP